MRNPLAGRLDDLAEAWNEQFAVGDQPIALRLLERMQMHGWARLIHECRLLHERLCLDLAEDGFDVERCSDIDFTRAFVCKSGDLIAYLYRKANRLPVTCFHNIEGLQAAPPAAHQRRALVILDDTIGTGSQFLFTFVARSAAIQALLQRYARVRLLQTPRRGASDGDRGAAAHLHGFRRRTPGAHRGPGQPQLAPRRTVAAGRDFPVLAYPLLSPQEREQLRGFLRRQQEAEGAGTTEFLLGHHSVFSGAPNAQARVLLPGT